jgi:hypothetical protein
MKVIDIPEYKKTLLFFEKAGSSLMAGFFKSLLDWKGIHIVDNGPHNTTPPNGERILFVRNPMERLVSIFYHLNIVRGTNVTSQQKMDKLREFLDTYEEKCKTSMDTHLLPQTSDYYPHPNDRIVKIEDIRDGYYRLTDGYKPSSNLNFGTQTSFFTAEEYIKDFGIVEDIGIPMDDKDRMFSATLYGFIMSKLNEGHHHNESHLMLGWLRMNNRGDVLNRLRRITQVEMDLFGYSNKTII